MTRASIAISLLLAAGAFVLTACGGGSQNDEAAIRDQNKKWQEAIVAKDAKAIAQIYAEDGAMFPPNAPKVQGRDALEKAWDGFVHMPGMTLTFDTDHVVFGKGGDLAIDVGTYKFASGEDAAQMNDTGKSVVSWIKRDGKWQVLTDMFSSDAPPPTPAPAAAPAETPATTPAPATPAPATPKPN